MTRIPGPGHAHLSSIEVGDLGTATGHPIDIQLGHHHVVKLKILRESTNGPATIEDRLPFQTMRSERKRTGSSLNPLIANLPKSMMTPTLSTT
jgi:hypothetical protein